MSCEDYTKFNNVDSVGSAHLLNQLEDNLKTFFDWGFLNIGGFVNVKIPTSGLSGGSFHDLRPSDQPGYIKGQLWQSPKKDWVWETGVVYKNVSPINISGVYINNTFSPAPTGSGGLGYRINYPLGQVVFNQPQSSNVRLEYSYRWCQVYKGSSEPYLAELQELSNKPAPQISQRDKGEYNLSSNHRVQTPCIIIEPIARSYSKPWQLGAHDFAIDQDILLHVFAENAADKNRIVDIIRLQKEKNIWLYDINKVVNSGINPLTYQGSKNINGKIYCDIVVDSLYRWKLCYFKDIVPMDMESRNKNLYWCTIRLTTQVII